MNRGIWLQSNWNWHVVVSELDLTPEKDGQHPKRHEIQTATPQQQLLLLFHAQQSPSTSFRLSIHCSLYNACLNLGNSRHWSSQPVSNCFHDWCIKFWFLSYSCFVTYYCHCANLSIVLQILNYFVFFLIMVYLAVFQSRILWWVTFWLHNNE